MEYIENSKYTKLAKKFLAGKTRKNYYEIIALNEDNLVELRFLQDFNEEEIKTLRVLREKYGKDDFVKHLDEVFTDPDVIHDFTCGFKILNINLDKPYHQYSFARHELRGDSFHRSEALVELSDEGYIRLLAYCIEDKDMNVNKLRYADKALYGIIIREVDNYLCDDGFFMGCNPYLITMDEIKEDAGQILAENPELGKTGTMGYLFI